MTRSTIKLPKLSPAVSQLLAHFGGVFLLAFGTQLVAGTIGPVSIPSLLALMTSAAAAGIIAVAHIILGLIPTPTPSFMLDGTTVNVAGFSLPTKLKSAAYQLWTSVAVTFIAVLGTELVSGAMHIGSIPDVVAVIAAAVMAAVTAVVQYLVGLVPAPKT